MVKVVWLGKDRSKVSRTFLPLDFFLLDFFRGTGCACLVRLLLKESFYNLASLSKTISNIKDRKDCIWRSPNDNAFIWLGQLLSSQIENCQLYELYLQIRNFRLASDGYLDDK